MSIGHIVGLLRATTIFPGIGVTLSPLDKSYMVALSNGNMTAMKRFAGTDWEAVRATHPRVSGKYYFEIQFNVIGAFGNSGLATANDRMNASPGFSTESLGWSTSGERFYNNVGTASALTNVWANGDTLCIAVDLDNKMVWARKNNTGWNTGIGGSGDPATNTGGFALPGSLATAPLFPMVAVQVATDQSTAKFAQSSFLYTAPAGFSPWESEPQLRLSQQRAHAIIGNPHAGLSLKQHTAFIPVGSILNGITIRDLRTYGLIGMGTDGSIGVRDQRAYAIVVP